MPPKKGMTANPVRPARYRPGKATAAPASSSEDEASEASEGEQEPAKPTPAPAPAPRASSFPKSAQPFRPQPAAQGPGQPAINEEEFETESSEAGSAQSGSESQSEEGSEGESEEESSSDDGTAKRKLLRPVFIKKDQRKTSSMPNGAAAVEAEQARLAEVEILRRIKADAMIQDELDKQAAAHAAGKKYWDDEDVVDEVDDTDDLDPESELALWKLREITRVKRERDALIEKEREMEEVERRRNMATPEREAEARERKEQEDQERAAKGPAKFLGRYHHQGAFYQPDVEEAGLAGRDVMGAKFEDEVDRSVLPSYMQVRDMTKIGRKGRTRYRDLRSEDTGRWGEVGDKKRYEGDERFRPDDDRYRSEGRRDSERTGANATAVGERKRGGEERTSDRDGKRPRVD